MELKIGLNKTAMLKANETETVYLVYIEDDNGGGKVVHGAFSKYVANAVAKKVGGHVSEHPPGCLWLD